MLEIGEIAGNRRGEGSTIKGIVEGLKHNKIRVLDIGNDELNLTIANSFKRLGVIPYRHYRVLGYGLLWSVASTAGEDPIIDFGNEHGATKIGKITTAITGGEKFLAYDRIKYDPLNLAADEKISEASATLVITRDAGEDFGVWKHNTPLNIYAQEAAVAPLSGGKVKPYVIIEVDTGGKW